MSAPAPTFANKTFLKDPPKESLAGRNEWKIEAETFHCLTVFLHGHPVAVKAEDDVRVLVFAELVAHFILQVLHRIRAGIDKHRHSNRATGYERTDEFVRQEERQPDIVAS